MTSTAGTAPRRTQVERRETAERRLLRAAAELTAEVGPAAMTLAAVGERAGRRAGRAAGYEQDGVVAGDGAGDLGQAGAVQRRAEPHRPEAPDPGGQHRAGEAEVDEDAHTQRSTKTA